MKFDLDGRDCNIPNIFIASCIVVVGLFFFYLFCVNHVAVNEMGIFYNAANGGMWTRETPGWYVTWPYPWVEEITIDLRPRKISIDSDARLVNAKLVRFRKEGWQEYVRRQGFNSPSEKILLGYAYAGREFSFVEVLEEPDRAQGQTPEKK